MAATWWMHISRKSFRARKKTVKKEDLGGRYHWYVPTRNGRKFHRSAWHHFPGSVSISTNHFALKLSYTLFSENFNILSKILKLWHLCKGNGLFRPSSFVGTQWPMCQNLWLTDSWCYCVCISWQYLRVAIASGNCVICTFFLYLKVTWKQC